MIKNITLNKSENIQNFNVTVTMMFNKFVINEIIIWIPNFKSIRWDWNGVPKFLKDN